MSRTVEELQAEVARALWLDYCAAQCRHCDTRISRPVIIAGKLVGHRCGCGQSTIRAEPTDAS